MKELAVQKQTWQSLRLPCVVRDCLSALLLSTRVTSQPPCHFVWNPAHWFLPQSAWPTSATTRSGRSPSSILVSLALTDGPQGVFSGVLISNDFLQLFPQTRDANIAGITSSCFSVSASLLITETTKSHIS